MRNQLLLRNYIRSILTEQAVSKFSNVAGILKESESAKSVAFYDAEKLLRIISEGDSLESIATECAVGYIKIKEPTYPCNKAWQISLTWGPGIGELIYGTGYALSPSNSLFPDRIGVSGKASAAWKGIFNNRDAKGIKVTPMDDIEDHNTRKPHDDLRKVYLNNMGFEDHTEDPTDDCRLFTRKASAKELQNFGHLDFYYDASAVVGKYQAMFNAALNKHQEVMDRLSSEDFLTSSSQVEKVLFDVIWHIAIDSIEPSV